MFVPHNLLGIILFNLENFQNAYALFFFHGLHASGCTLLCNLQCLLMCGLQARQSYHSCNLYTHFKPQTNALLYMQRILVILNEQRKVVLFPVLCWLCHGIFTRLDLPFIIIGPERPWD